VPALARASAFARAGLAAGLAACALVPGAAVADGPYVTGEADLHLRFTSWRQRPDSDILYDPSRYTFALEGYLVPSVDETYPSALVSAALEGRALDGDLRWRFGAGSGEARRKAFPSLQDVCLQNGGTGLGPPSGPGCLAPGLHRIVSLETTVPADPILTLGGRPAATEAQDTWLIREAWASLAFGRAGFARLTAGRRRITVADGLVHDDTSAGIEAAFDLGAIGPPFEVAAGLLVPSRDWPTAGATGSPMLVARAAWLPSLFESVGVFAAAMQDRSGGVAEMLRGQNEERAAVRLARAQADPSGADEVVAAGLLASTLAAHYESDASLLWLGTSGALSPLPGQRLTWTAAALEGTIDSVDVPRGTLLRDVAVHGGAARVRWDVELPRGFSAGGAFLWLTGGTLPEATVSNGELVAATGTYRGFLGVAPLVPHANLFFGGGLSETFSTLRTTAPGVNGRGVLSPAASLSWYPSEAFGLDTRLAWLRADVTGPYGGKVYGTELDLSASFTPVPWLSVGLEWDVLWPGDFYGGQSTVTKKVIAVDVLTP